MTKTKKAARARKKKNRKRRERREKKLAKINAMKLAQGEMVNSNDNAAKSDLRQEIEASKDREKQRLDCEHELMKSSRVFDNSKFPPSQDRQQNNLNALSIADKK